MIIRLWNLDWVRLEWEYVGCGVERDGVGGIDCGLGRGWLNICGGMLEVMSWIGKNDRCLKLN